MNFPKNIDLNELIGHKTIIYGEINTGKTKYTAKFIQFLIENIKIDPSEISILDFGPNLLIFKGKRIGGMIRDFYEHSEICNNIKLGGEIIPPRLNAINRDEIYENALHNYRLTSSALKKFNENPTSILIINDISIYLHMGEKKSLLKAIKNCVTFLGNTYYGHSIRSEYDSEFNIKERKDVEKLLKEIENSYKIT